MIDLNIILSILWVACMLTYLLGDVMRIFSGNFIPGHVEGKPMGQKVWFGMAVIMVIPIIMVFLSVILAFPANSWVNIFVAGFFILFNLAGMKGYKPFDIFLLLVSMVFNALIIYYASTGFQI
ncbi:MAG: DUF6326 family protein [Candidatus Heimdallarchaeaceae archaeon]